MNINEIKELLLVIDKTNLGYVKLENSELKLEVSKNIKENKNLLEINTKETDITNPANPNREDEFQYIVAPLMGTFYNSPSPNAKSFVQVGSIVKKGDTLCILEAMKLMNEITSDVNGEIIEILASNEELVEYNQPLFKVKTL